MNKKMELSSRITPSRLYFIIKNPRLGLCDFFIATNIGSFSMKSTNNYGFNTELTLSADFLPIPKRCLFRSVACSPSPPPSRMQPTCSSPNPTQSQAAPQAEAPLPHPAALTAILLTAQVATHLAARMPEPLQSNCPDARRRENQEKFEGSLGED